MTISSTLTMDLLSFDEDGDNNNSNNPNNNNNKNITTNHGSNRFNSSRNRGDLIELGDVADQLATSNNNDSGEFVLGPEPDILNKHILNKKVKKKLSRKLSEVSEQRQMRRAEDETQIEIRKKLSYIALAFAALLMIMSVVAIFLDGVNGGRFLGSVTYSILVILLSFRAIFPPRIEQGCCRFPESHPIFWFVCSISVICAFVLVGWLVSFKHHESAFANGILVLAFIDLVYFAAEQLHQQLYISIAVVAVLLILDVFIHYEATFYDQNIGFEIFCAIVIVVHAPINFLSVTHRWDMVQLGKGTKKKKKKRKRKRKGANTTVNATDSDSDGSSNDSDGENAIGNNNNNKYNNLDMESDDDEKLIGA